MREMKKTSQGSWPPEAKLRQEKLFQSENFLKVGVRAKCHHTRIKWKCPPQFSLCDEWHVVAGEESVQLESQMQRERSVLEEVYIRPSSIPPNPSILLDLYDQSQNDSYILHVPLIPIEEEEEKVAVAEAERAPPAIQVVPHNSSLPQLNPDSRKSELVSTSQCNLHVSSKPVAKDSSSRHGIPHIHGQDIIVSRKQPGNTASSSEMLHASEVDPEVAAAAALAAFARSIDQRNLIDADLLTLLLRNPEMVDQLMNGHGLAPSLKTETSPKPNPVNATLSASLPSSKPNLFSEKRATTGNTKHTEAESTALSRPVEVNVSHSLPRRKPEVLICKSSDKHEASHAGFEPVFRLNPLGKPVPLVSSIPRTSSGKDLLDECRALPQAGMPNMAGIYPSTPLTSKQSVEQAKKLINEYGEHETIVHKSLPKAEHSTNMAVSVERLKKLINEYGAHESVGHNPFPRSEHSNNTPLSVEMVKMLINDYGTHETPGHEPFSRSEYSNNLLVSPKTTSPSILQSNLHAMPLSPNIAYAQYFSAKINLAPPHRDLGYDSPIAQQRKKEENVDGLLLKYLRPDLYLQEPVFLQNPKPCRPGYPTSKHQKSCKFFNTSKGCRNGSKCPFQHDVMGAPGAKRMKLPTGIFQGRHVTEGITG